MSKDKKSQSGSTPIHPVSGKKSAVDVTKPLEVPGKLHSEVEIQQTPQPGFETEEVKAKAGRGAAWLAVCSPRLSKP